MAALTATAQSALHPGPSWDETIVPTLRKRLEQESRMLANRLSQASLGDDGYGPNLYQFSSPASSPPQSPSIKPSAIPRPSLSQSPPFELDSQSASSSRPAHFKRARTQSTPYVYDGLMNGSGSPPPPETPRSTSPAVNGRPTRIPISPRARSPSASSHFSSNTSEANATPRQNGFDMAAVDGASRSSVNIGRQPGENGSGILGEQPPFAGDQVSLRSSMDSEEHPYEHWYRGDYSRNGGVGELRVGKRMEMLEIASYGHSLRKMPSKTTVRTSLADTEVTTARRRRAESFSARGSLYMDDAEAQMMFDEPPLTDFERVDDMSTEGGASSNSHAAALPASLLATARTPIPSRIPARRQPTESPRMPAVNGTRNFSGPSTFASSSTTQINTPTKPRASPSTPSTPTRSRVNSAAAASAKRRAKSPAVSSPPSSAKKAKQARTPPRKPRDDDSRRSIAEYPIPKDGDDDMADAIPVWTQPKSRDNWDEVVLPVVARKKGLHGLYEEADGSTPQKKPEETDPAPAPGTFGFDYSKYKRSRTDLAGEDIPMDEFGQRGEWRGEPVPPVPAPVSLDDDPELDRERARVRQSAPRPPESPVPFARYHTPKPEAMSANGHAPQAQMQVSAEEEEEAGGCCKCVIM